MGVLDQMSPQQKQLLLAGAPVVAVFAFVASKKKQAVQPTGMTTPIGLGSGGVGLDQLASFENSITDVLAGLEQSIADMANNPNGSSQVPPAQQQPAPTGQQPAPTGSRPIVNPFVTPSPAVIGTPLATYGVNNPLGSAYRESQTNPFYSPSLSDYASELGGMQRTIAYAPGTPSNYAYTVDNTNLGSGPAVPLSQRIPGERYDALGRVIY